MIPTGLARLGLLAGAIALWWAAVVLFRIPAYILPPPDALLAKAVFLWQEAGLGDHLMTTLAEIAVGFAIGAATGLAVGQLFGHQPLAERLLSPIVVLVQALPKISLAPLLALWMGLGLAPKVVLIAIVVFFPVMANALIAVRTVDGDVRALMTLLRLGAWARFRLVELPHSLPLILAGVRVATTQAVTAAVIAELMGAKGGLGFLLSTGQETADVGVVLVSLTVLSLLGYGLYEMVGAAERRLLAWQA